MAYGDFKDLTRRTAFDKILRDKAFNTANNPKYHKNENISDQRPSNLATRQLAEELHKPIIRKFNKRKVQSLFIDNIWCADLADMQLISKFSKEFRFLLCVIEIYSKYAWVIPLQ